MRDPMTEMNPGDISGPQKAAILLISLGPELSSNVFKHLSEEEIEQITLEIAATRSVPVETRQAVLEEFHQMALAKEYIAEGGITYAREVLERALGNQKALEILQRLTASLQVRPFEFIRRADATQVLSFVQGEHPQTIALIMAYLGSEQAALILSALPPDRQADVARRIAIMDRTSPEILKEVEKVLERKLANVVSHDYTSAGGLESVVDVLNRVDRTTEKTIMDTLELQDPELAEEIKKRMFLFDDLVYLDNRSMQRMLREVDMSKDLPVALKMTSEEVKRKVFTNISKRAGETLEEAMDYLGPVRLRDVEEAQQRILDVIRRLEDAGEIIMARGGGDDVIV